MSIVRKRTASQKAYIPANARDNQYILAEFALSDQLLSQLSSQENYYDCYQSLADLLFTLSNDYAITNSFTRRQ